MNHARNAARAGLLSLQALLPACAGAHREARPADVPPRRESAAPPGLLAVDPAVRAGRLPNGLRWFVRPNRRPEGRAEVWLAVNAGSLQEDEDQLGLAHFVEHMAFNGTQRFEKHEIVDFLERIGMRFGPDVNAWTSFDETVYTLTIPTDDPSIVERAFTILQEWARGIALEEEEIDAERGVVLEEWRLDRGADARIRDLQLPVILSGSRYAERLPIGRKEIIESAPHGMLRRFYRDWYRPDLMAVIAVGDFDAGRIQSLIEEKFSRLDPRPAARPRESWPVPDHERTLVTIATDPEATSTSIRIYYKLPKRPEGTDQDYRRSLVEALYHAMLNERFDEITERPDPPFLYAISTTDSLVRSRDVYFKVAGVREGAVRRALEALLTEAERVDRHGFTPSELDRAKRDLLRFYEQAWKERDTEDSSLYAEEILRHFLEGEPMPGIGAELDLVRSFLPGITIEEVNRSASAWISEENRVIAVSAPESGGPPPREEDLLAVFEEVARVGIAPWEDKVLEAPLLAAPPEPGRIVREESIAEIGATRWEMSNGVEVYLKPTAFRKDEILLSAWSPGGHSLVEDRDHTSATFAASIVEASGAGAFDATELKKALAGKVAADSTWIGELEEGATASASPEDVETMLQLLYLRFTAPRRDEEAYVSLVQRLRGFIENREASPETAFGDRMKAVLSQGHPRRRPLSMEILGEVDLDRALAIYEDRFADAGDFTFVLVGSFEPDAVRSLLATYLGGLPSAGREETWRDVGVRPPEGVVRDVVRKGIEPKSEARIVFTGESGSSRIERHRVSSLASLMRLRLHETLREEMGGTYDVGVDGLVERRPRERYVFDIGFGCAPEAAEGLVAAIFSEIGKVKEAGATDLEVEKIKEGQLRQRETDLEENGFWLAALGSYLRFGEDPRLILDFDALVGDVSSESLRDSARRYLRSDRYVQGILLPEGSP